MFIEKRICFPSKSGQTTAGIEVYSSSSQELHKIKWCTVSHGMRPVTLALSAFIWYSFVRAAIVTFPLLALAYTTIAVLVFSHNVDNLPCVVPSRVSLFLKHLIYCRAFFFIFIFSRFLVGPSSSRTHQNDDELLSTPHLLQ